MLRHMLDRNIEASFHTKVILSNAYRKMFIKVQSTFLHLAKKTEIQFINKINPERSGQCRPHVQNQPQ
jgi:hypothetical protein